MSGECKNKEQETENSRAARHKKPIRIGNVPAAHSLVSYSIRFLISNLSRILVLSILFLIPVIFYRYEKKCHPRLAVFVVQKRAGANGSFDCGDRAKPSTLTIILIVKKADYSKASVSSAHPLASLVGAAIMKSGGNAFDAAIATQLRLRLCIPVRVILAAAVFYWRANQMANSLASITAKPRPKERP
jgi:hypothetical protein